MHVRADVGRTLQPHAEVVFTGLRVRMSVASGLAEPVMVGLQ